MDKLQAIDSFGNLGCDMTFPPTSYEQIQSLSQTYVAALTQNLDERCAASSDVISALSVLDPVSVPEYEADGFQEYGIAQVNILAKHFFQIETEEVQKLKTEKLLTERSHMKYHVNDNIKKIIPTEVKSSSSKTTTTEWSLLHLLKSKSSFVTFFPLLLYIAEVVVSLPVSTAWPERGDSSSSNECLDSFKKQAPEWDVTSNTSFWELMDQMSRDACLFSRMLLVPGLMQKTEENFQRY